MPSGPIVWLLLILLIAAGLYFLSRSAEEVPTETIEVEVELPEAAAAGDSEA